MPYTLKGGPYNEQTLGLAGEGIGADPHNRLVLFRLEGVGIRGMRLGELQP